MLVFDDWSGDLGGLLLLIALLFQAFLGREATGKEGDMVLREEDMLVALALGVLRLSFDGSHSLLEVAVVHLYFQDVDISLRLLRRQNFYFFQSLLEALLIPARNLELS